MSKIISIGLAALCLVGLSACHHHHHRGHHHGGYHGGYHGGSYYHPAPPMYGGYHGGHHRHR